MATTATDGTVAAPARAEPADSDESPSDESPAGSDGHGVLSDDSTSDDAAIAAVSSSCSSSSGLLWSVPRPFSSSFLSRHYDPLAHDLYFAYGSNLNFARMQARRIHVVGGQGLSARLSRFRLLFDKLSEALGEDGFQHGAIGYANLVPSASESVHGVVYILAKPHGLLGLDAYEGVAEGEYARTTVEIHLQDGASVTATTYLACPRACSPHPGTLAPTRSYLNHLLAGRPLLPTTYVERLEQTKLSWMEDPALGVSMEKGLEVNGPTHKVPTAASKSSPSPAASEAQEQK